MGCTQSTQHHAAAAAVSTTKAVSQEKAAVSVSTKTAPSTSSSTLSLPHDPGGSKKKHALASNFIVEKKQNVKDHYTTMKSIGEGSIGSIFLVQKKLHGTELAEADESETETNETQTQRRGRIYALKEIDKEKVDPESLEEMRNEINLMKNIDHPNVIKAYEVYEDKGGTISIIMEYCSGGDLCSREPYTEAQAQYIIVKVVQAISYLHSQGIMHRDLKFENILFESEAPDAQPKIIDFGLGTKYGKEERFSDRVGTIVTMSPEAIRGDHDNQTDMWSVGVICFQLLSGKLPFWGDSMMAIAKQICTLDYNMNGPEWDNVSSQAKSFVKWCLRIDPKLRYTPQKALQSAWLRDFVDSEKERRLANPTTRTVMENAIHTNNPTSATNRRSSRRTSDGSVGEFRRLALNTVAHKVSTREIAELREVFHALDADHDGELTIQEMRAGLGEQFDESTIDEWFGHVDVDANGKIHYTEFLAATLEAQHSQQQGDLSLFNEDRVRQAFATFDRDDTGYITADSLREALGISKEDKNEYIERLIRQADTNKDGLVSYDEFQNILRKHAESSTRCLVKMNTLGLIEI